MIESRTHEMDGLFSNDVVHEHSMDFVPNMSNQGVLINVKGNIYSVC